jgi:hypothetical protein
MAWLMHPHPRSLIISGAVAVVVGGLWLRSHADPPAPPVQTTLLQQLSAETQQLYLQSRRSMVRVQLPTPQWLAEYNARQNLLNKYPQLDPKAREQFMEEQERALQQLRHPSTTQATGPASTQPVPLRIHVTDTIGQPESGLALFAVGLLVDTDGHAVFPVYMDHKSLGDSPWPAVTGENELTTAKFVGSDMKTNLTVLQLEKHSGVPAVLGHSRPEDGVLTLSIARDGSAKLIVWSNQRPEPGFAILTDGSMAGFRFRQDHFLGASPPPNRSSIN